MTFLRFMSGPWGRAIRIAAGLALIIIGLASVGGGWGVAMAVVGLAPLTSGITGYCPICAIAGDSCAWEPQS